MEKFNKGPWVRAGNTVIHEKSRFGICKVIGEDDVDIANAALIAAAPEMYDDIKRDIDWLKQMRRFFVIGSDGFRACSLRIESKQKLLAKARGEQ